MEHYEMVEKLRQKANVSYEEAKAALEKTDWDILDALVLLESEGKVKGEEGAKEYSTQAKPNAKTRVRVEVEEGAFKEGLRKFWKFLCRMFRKGNANSFVVKDKKGEEKISMPITVLVLLLIMCWPISLVVLIVALFMNYRYSFRGPDISAKVNEAMDKAADAMQGEEEEKE
ncbi:MAG: DUF4342 domain-containing protein [Clostridiales bacterium]|nr:DUF4342 domain-containing protein [Clostridiales bacterium]